jgi:hypothetical protein
MPAGTRALTTWLPSHHLALGGGGLAHLLVRLFIWHEIFRLFRYLWRIPTFGPYIVIALGVVIIGLLVWRQTRRSGRWRQGGGGWSARSRQNGRGGSSGPDAGSGPRDW